MKKIEYCIVGGGYAGIFLAHQCILRKKSFVLFDEGLSSASKISAGMVNPVVLKKFTTFWKAAEQIDVLAKTMEEIERYIGENFFVKAPIHRIFHDEQEQKLWNRKRQTQDLHLFLEEEKVVLPQIHNEYGCGRVIYGGYVKVLDFFEKYYRYLHQKRFWVQQKFECDILEASNGKYGEEYTFDKIIFCEGIAVKHNPFFKNTPISPNKGHQLNISFSNSFQLAQIIKKKHFLIPISPQKYYYGGTYDRHDTTTSISSEAIHQLCQGVELITDVPYTIEEKNMAFRATVSDRRPILGKHAQFEKLYIFNGLGARGLLNGAYFSPILMDFMEGKKALPQEVTLQRFFDVDKG